MTVRRLLFALATVTVLHMTATARPPISPLPEGRELDPVTRDHYLPYPTANATEDAAPRRVTEPTCEMAGESMLVNILNTILNDFTIPLGTVQESCSL